jgi:hypothetical protein
MLLNKKALPAWEAPFLLMFIQMFIQLWLNKQKSTRTILVFIGDEPLSTP